MRIRNKCFVAWKFWAPRKRRLRKLKSQTKLWLFLRKKQVVFGEMTRQCFDVVGRRAAVLRIMRRNVNDRRVLVCAYALLGLNTHTIMLDCWRRWTKWWQGRCRWKASLWHYRYLWHFNKQRSIFQAWRDFALNHRGSTSYRPNTTIDTTKGSERKSNLWGDAATSPTTTSDNDGSRPNTGVAVPPRTAIREWEGVPYSPLMPDIMFRAARNFTAGQMDEHTGMQVDHDPFLLFCRAVCMSHRQQEEKRQVREYVCCLEL